MGKGKLDQETEKRMLVTVPYAGGSSVAFTRLLAGLNGLLQYHHDYPGHGMRAGEDFGGDLYGLSRELAEEILRRRPADMPFLIMGHSMGAMVAFYCEQILEQEYHVSADQLILSACLPPVRFYEHRQQFETVEEIKQYLLETRKVPADILDSCLFRKHMLEPFINDVRVIHEFVPKEDVQVDTDILGICGSEDEDVAYGDMADWKKYTRGNFTMRMMEGDHFFPESNPDAFLREIKNCLDRYACE